jgi:glucose-6-phosphate 1-epimerase
MTKEQAADSLEVLGEKYAIPGQLIFRKGEDGLVYAEITNNYGQARVFLQGAHLTHYQPCGGAAVIWLSSVSCFEVGRSIRGGIPICWPWFGNNSDDPGKPAHGFARTSLWQVAETGEGEDNGTFIRLFLVDDEKTKKLWPYSFRLELTISVGKSLYMTLAAHNTGLHSFKCTGALHSYFRVADVASIEISGLNGCKYLDKVEKFSQKQQCGPVRFKGETDRIYLDTVETCEIIDPQMKRKICIEKKGSLATVVWNPGAEKATIMTDMQDDAYRQMVCVETANAATDTITILPGKSHILQAEIIASSRL